MLKSIIDRIEQPLLPPEAKMKKLFNGIDKILAGMVTTKSGHSV